MSEAKRDHLTCHYCGLHHTKVEAGGVWYCPNLLCTGPGAHGWRSKLKSYKEVENNRHTVDHQEAIAKATAAAWDEADEVIKAAIFNSLPKWTQ